MACETGVKRYGMLSVVGGRGGEGAGERVEGWVDQKVRTSHKENNKSRREEEIHERQRYHRP